MPDPQPAEQPDGSAAVLIRALTFATEAFLCSAHWAERGTEVLAEVAAAVGATRALLYENDGPAWRLSARWPAPPAAEPGERRFHRWVGALAQGGVIHGAVRDLPDGEALQLSSEGVASVMAIPVFAGRDWWGAIVLEDSASAEAWSPPECQVVRSAGRALGAALSEEGWRKSSRQLMDRLEREAHYDDLTGAPNRRLFQDHARRQLSLARRQGSACALLLVDLDRFKDINDSLGHQAGDRALVEVAQRLEKVIRMEDLLARMGGDEFAILLADADAEAVGSACNRLREALQAPLKIADRELYVGASVGVAISPGDGTDLDDLLKHADIAMYRAKAEGGGIRMFDAAQDEAAQQRFGIESDLRGAIRNGELSLMFQPIVDLERRSIAGAEVLCRWSHPRRGVVPPSVFVEMVEGTALGVDLDRWVLAAAVRRLGAWRKAGWRGWLSVNISARTLETTGLAAEIEALLQSTGVDSAGLVVELTERVLANPRRALPALAAVRSLGVRAAVDDFGTGHASFAYLEQMPLDLLKIDQRFVQKPWRHVATGRLLKTMTDLSHAAGLHAIAEGVETREQLVSVMESGCDLAQGYLFSRPVDADTFLRDFRHPAALATKNVWPSRPPGPRNSQTSRIPLVRPHLPASPGDASRR